MSNKNEVKHKTSVGGEALIEGIMMNGPKGAAMSVRLPNGEVETEFIELKRWKDKHKFLGWPLIRGVAGFIESMKIGYGCLMKSAEKAGMDLDGDEEELSKFDQWIMKVFGEKMMAVISGIAVVLGLVLAFALFFWLPTLVFEGISSFVEQGFSTPWQTFASLFTNQGKVLSESLQPFKGLIEGVMRMAIFIIYIALVSRMQEINRVFQYHGAEHKTIFCYEKGLDLTVENVRAQSRFHPRCGTSFIFMMLILSIIVSTSLSFIVPQAIVNNRALWIALKILIIPLLMGVGYEINRYAGRHDGLWVRIVTAPGLWMQRLTTKEPSEDGMIEIGIASLEAVITENPEDDAI